MGTFLLANMSNQLVVLLHGIARTSRSMNCIARVLTKHNYAVMNIDYPSRSNTIDHLSEGIYQQLLTYPEVKDKKIHFVAHSMGCLALRVLLEKYKMQNVQRIAVLGPPNQGSEVADFARRIPLIKTFYGPALAELTVANATDHPFPLPPGCCHVGIIAGNFNVDPICYFMLTAPHDGKVTVNCTKLPNMADHIALLTSHSFMM